MKIGCIVEARMASSRLPGKVLLDLMGKPAVIRQVERIQASRYIDTIVVATTVNPGDDPLVEVLEEAGIKYFRGSEEDVLDRVASASRAFELDVLVEITGDCPLVDMGEGDRVIERYLQGGYDLVSNEFVRSYPIGMDVLAVSSQVLQQAARQAADPAYREHVCLYLYEHPFDYNFSNIEAPPFLRNPRLRLTLDTWEDYELIRRIYEKLYPVKPDFNLYDISKLLNREPELREINRQIEQRKVR